MAGGRLRWDLAEAWAAASEVTAAAWAVDAAAIKAPTRGRGARPPPQVWEPKKIAVYLAISLSNGDQAELARLLGMHKDTVSSHCAWARERALVDARFEVQLETVLAAADVRLQLQGCTPLGDGDDDGPDPSTPRGRLAALQLHMSGVFAKARAALSDVTSDASRASSDDHENVMMARGRA